MKFPFLILFTCGTGIGLIMVANLFFYTILGEVNAKAPTEQQISMFFANVKFFDVLRQHAKFYPNSRKRIQMMVFLVAGFSAAIVGLVAGVAHYTN